MKKLFSYLSVVMFVSAASAGTVSVNTATTVATNFFKSTSPDLQITSNLVYTEHDSHNTPLFYVFNINSSDGFVIVSANDVFYPIVGYSTEKRAYQTPVSGTNIYYWMQLRKTEIETDLSNNVKATDAITARWNYYINYKAQNNVVQRTMSASIFPSYSSYLVKSTWDQPAPYDNDCPGTGPNKAVTGCVATAMCQIMRYWQYPVKGQSGSGYNAGSYGYLTANYNHPYPWSAMSLTSASGDTNLPRVMSDAGISVDMSYSPTGSGAWVITSDNSYACAQISYVKYFKYSPSILDGVNAFANQTVWRDTLEHEINCMRPIQYVGFDPNNGGHTWVCDGFDSNANFHMNWGWSGYDNGWYAISNLNPAGMNFSQGHEALLGIMPPPATAAPVANFMATTTTTCTANLIQYIDTSANQPGNWQWTFPGGSPSSSTLQDPSVVYFNTGTYPVSLVVSNSFGTDSVSYTSYVTIDSAPAAPTVVVNGSSVSCVPATYAHYQWYRNGSPLTDDTTSQFWAGQIGAYWVQVTNPLGCPASSTHVELTVLGDNNLSNSTNINVYPNPSSGILNISFNGLQGNNSYTITLTDVLGRTVYTEKASIQTPLTKQINVEGFGKGTYILSVVGNGQKLTRTVILN